MTLYLPWSLDCRREESLELVKCVKDMVAPHIAQAYSPAAIRCRVASPLRANNPVPMGRGKCECSITMKDATIPPHAVRLLHPCDEMVVQRQRKRELTLRTLILQLMMFCHEPLMSLGHVCKLAFQTGIVLDGC